MKKLLSSLLFIFATMVALPAFAALPSGYTELEYIESTGTQYIDTGLTVDTGAITATATFAPTSLVSPTNHYSTIFGRNSMFQAGYWNAKAYIGSMPSDNDFFVVNKKTVVTGVLTTTAANSAYYVDGVSTGLKRNFATGETVLLLNSEASAQHAAIGKLYNFTAERNGSTIMNLVPARRESDGQVGMYDTVSGTFFTNAGTGAFTAGPEVINCGNLVEFNETRIDKTTWASANKSHGFEVFADVYGKHAGDSLFTNGNCFGVFVPAALNESISLNFFDYTPYPGRAYYCEVTADGKCNTEPARYYVDNGWITHTFTLTQPDSIGFVIEWNIAANQTRNYTAANYTVVKGSAVPTEALAYCATPIKIATTAYNAARFNPVKTDLDSAVATIREIVTKTINQTAAIASLQADKQTRPEEQCPAGKKCLLVETEENGVIVPHWFPIIEVPE